MSTYAGSAALCRTVSPSQRRIIGSGSRAASRSSRGAVPDVLVNVGEHRPGDYALVLGGPTWLVVALELRYLHVLVVAVLQLLDVALDVLWHANLSHAAADRGVCGGMPVYPPRVKTGHARIRKDRPVESELITTQLADHVLTITLNRPERLNAWTATMGRELIEAFDRADADDEVRAVIVTGAGRAYRGKPVIGAINGAAVGVGSWEACTPRVTCSRLPTRWRRRSSRMPRRFRSPWRGR